MATQIKPSPLSRMEQQRRALEHKIKQLQRKELLRLPARVGLESVDHLILTLVEYASPALKARLSTSHAVAASSVLPAGNGTGAGLRTKFSSELREMIRKELESGLKSVAEISREYGPSHPTIMGWKREWGMTRPRNHRTGNGAK